MYSSIEPVDREEIHKEIVRWMDASGDVFVAIMTDDRVIDKPAALAQLQSKFLDHMAAILIRMGLPAPDDRGGV